MAQYGGAQQEPVGQKQTMLSIFYFLSECCKSMS